MTRMGNSRNVAASPVQMMYLATNKEENAACVRTWRVWRVWRVLSETKECEYISLCEIPVVEA